MVDFLVIGPDTIVQYNNIFPLIKDRKILYGFKRDRGHMWFECDGKLMDVNSIRWFQSLIDVPPEKIVLEKKFSDIDYKKFDNTDIINIDDYRDIPGDYEGLMAVPVTFVRHWNPDQFEMVDLKKTGCFVEGESKFSRFIIKKNDMGKNKNLLEAKQAKNDEFYTRYEDIAKEVVHYKDKLEGRIVYCCCDDYRWSNFVKYFKDHFQEYKLKKLIATNYNIGDGAYKYEYDGVNETVEKLKFNGDFRSEECTKIKNMPGVVVITNPPFSLFREFIDWLREDERFAGETSLW